MRLLVTGAAGGIGHALVALAREDGAEVVALARDAREAEGLAALLPADRIILADLAARAGRAGTERIGAERIGAGGIARAASDRLGGALDGVAHVAGVFDHRSSAETSLADWEAVIDVNLTAAFVLASEALPLLGKGGSLVLVSSQIGLVGHPRAAAYTASKAAINGLVKSLALEAAPRGVRVNAVAPGPIATPMTEALRLDPERTARAIAATPLGRFGEAAEIAHAIRFLLSPAAGFITGSVLVADGGFTAA